MCGDPPAHGRHSCHGARGRLHSPGTKGGVIFSRKRLETASARVLREHTSMKTGLTLLSQHLVERENITQCTNTSSMHINSSFPSSSTDSQQNRTSKTQA